jgi:ABC-type transporter Mla subunit MlaD
MKNPIGLIDRLEERGFIDRWGFVFFAFVGSILIVLAKQFGAAAVLVTVGAVASLLIYAWLVSSRGTAKLRSDQAGDNCYYLGLIYTLSSLAYAIFTFDPANTATTVVQGFGIALATTIAGLVLRVFFNQSRVDLYEMEDSARLELAQAAARLKTELSQIAVSFSDFGHQTQQIIAEVRDGALASIEDGAKRSIDTVAKVAELAQEALQHQSSDLATKTKRLGETSDKVAAAMERHSEGLEEIVRSSGSFSGIIKSLERAAAGARESADAAGQQISQATDAHASVADSSRAIAAAAGRVGSLVADTSTALTRLHLDLEARLREVEQGPKAAVEGAFAGVGEVAARLRGAVDELVAAHRRAAEEMQGETTSVVAALRSHNSELDKELARSRENVARVHGALVEMTGELVHQVERRGS